MLRMSPSGGSVLVFRWCISHGECIAEEGFAASTKGARSDVEAGAQMVGSGRRERKFISYDVVAWNGRGHSGQGKKQQILHRVISNSESKMVEWSYKLKNFLATEY